jgi:CheY-like chemotaxis protein/signal transduction histidine kinase
VLLFVVALGYYARSFRDILVESWRLRFENVHLIEELQEKKAEAEEANVAKSRFLAAASHDLRQPLHALTLFVSALDERRHAPEVRAIVDNVNVSVQALEKMFNALLDISRLDAGVLHPACADFRLQELFDRLVNEYGPAASQKGLELRCSASSAVIRSDSALLERILRNYLTNAIRYTEHGRVTLRAVAGEDEVRVEVEDTGIGIPPDQHREIFREFHQLQNPERDRTKGLGLGLAIVERLSRLLNHPIAVESAPGSGSLFSVTVPAGDPTAVEDGRDRATERVFADLAGLRVLVIDDESGVRDGMRTLLVQWGCEVLLAAGEDEAMTQLHRDGCAPDAIVADYRLREGRTGVQAIGRVHDEWGARIPALIVTGETAAEELKEVETSGYSLLYKPVPPGQLRAFLRDARRKQAPDQ